MRLISALFAVKTGKKDPIPFQERLPLKLNQTVSGKGDRTSDVCCIHEMSVMFACFKNNDFNQSICSKEIDGFQKCYNNHLTQKYKKQVQEERGILTPGEKRLSHKQMNILLKKFPNIKD